MSTEIRDRLATIVEENYEDEWGYPPNGIFTDIADAILEEFNLARKYSITELFAERTNWWDERVTVGFQVKDGPVYTREMSERELLNLTWGNGSPPEEDRLAKVESFIDTFINWANELGEELGGL